MIEIEGEILSQSIPESIFSVGVMGSEDIAKKISRADGRSDIKAIMFQINSPGGSVVGSREIYMAIREAEKPTLAYFREMAASGGYYVGAGADYIVSEPDALTGSIGARMTLMELSGFFEKLGYNETTIKSGEFKDIGSYAREATEEEKEILEVIIQQAYQGFEDDIIEGRGDRLNMELFYENATDARILTGRQAYEIGLVDEVGSKKDAIKKASQMAGFEQELEICKIEEGNSGFFSQILGANFDLNSIFQKPKTSLEYR